MLLNEHKCEKATLKKLGLFKINVYFKILINVKQLEVINFASLISKWLKILEYRLVSQLERKHMAQIHAAD